MGTINFYSNYDAFGIPTYAIINDVEDVERGGGPIYDFLYNKSGYDDEEFDRMVDELNIKIPTN